MGKRSDRRKFRRRRRWAGFFLLLSLSLVVSGVMLIRDMTSPDLQTTASGSVDKVGVARVASVRVPDAPEATEDKAEFLALAEEGKKTAAEKNEVDTEAGQKADEKVAARDQAAQKAKEPDQKSDPKPSGSSDARAQS